MPAAAVQKLQADLQAAAAPAKAAFFPRFFKAGPGEYAHGDRFLGVTVPVQRALAKKYLASISLADIAALLHRPIHEERLPALILLVGKFQQAPAQTAIYQLYLRHTAHINNWDLVDASAAQIVGPYLVKRDRGILTTLTRSDSLWERRIALIATFHFIKQRHYATTLQIASLLLHDPHDFIHKAVGWMLREIGKRDRATLETFLAPHYQTMPRTMLRYAIEHFRSPGRQRYLKGKI